MIMTKLGETKSKIPLYRCFLTLEIVSHGYIYYIWASYGKS